MMDGKKTRSILAHRNRFSGEIKQPPVVQTWVETCRYLYRKKKRSKRSKY